MNWGGEIPTPNRCHAHSPQQGWILSCWVVTYLFVHLCPALDLCHYHPHDGASVGGCEGKELLVGSDVSVP